MNDGQNMPGIGSWKALGAELKRRSVDPLMHASFVIYFVVAIILLGAAGIWLELYTYFAQVARFDVVPASSGPLRTAVITFFPALAGTACMQLVWAESDQRYLRAFAMLILIVLAGVALIIGQVSFMSNLCALWIGGFASFVALWSWWIANADQEGFRDVDPDAPVGGADEEAPLAGDLNGLTV